MTTDFRSPTSNLAEVRSSSADGLAVPEGREPTRDELWELWLRLNNELPDRQAAVAEFWEHAQIDARARAAKADGPAVPEGREPAAVVQEPSDAELVGKLVEAASGAAAMGWDHHAQRILRAAELLQRQAPQPPADGEVVEVVEWLHTVVAAYKSCRNTDHIWSLSGNGVNARLTVTLLTRAAELLQRQVPVPVPVSERLPEPSTKVLAHYFNDLGRKRTICAIWVPAKSRSGDIGDDDDFTEYDEEDDKFYWPEGWYEAIENWDDLGWIHVDEGEVVYWQPLPKWPAHALPLPEVSE